ncbi:phosphotriesterase family protein [Spirochaeta dissipatitropha]
MGESTALHKIQTVRGQIQAEEGSRILAHEHIMVDFIGAEKTGPERWNRAEVADRIIPYLIELKAQDVNMFFDCTPAYLGRDPVLLKNISEQTNIHIITNTGFYKDEYLPEWARQSSVEKLAELWISEFKYGIDGTDIKPGFIKAAVNPGPLNPEARNCLRAAAICCRETELTIATHCGDAEAAHEILDILDSESVPSSKWILVHSQLVTDNNDLLDVAGRGCYIELDGLAWGDYDNHAEKLGLLVEHGYSRQVLLSQDAGWYHVGEENGGNVIGYTALINDFIPFAEQRIDGSIIEKIIRRNPLEAYACITA